MDMWIVLFALLYLFMIGGLAYVAIQRLRPRKATIKTKPSPQVAIDMHPALMCELLRTDHATAFFATLLRLTMLGAITPSHGNAPSDLPVGEFKYQVMHTVSGRDIRNAKTAINKVAAMMGFEPPFTIKPDSIDRFVMDLSNGDVILSRNDAVAEKLTDPIDRAIMNFLFSFLAARAVQVDGTAKRPDGAVRLSDLVLVANKDLGSFRTKRAGWRKLTESAFLERYPRNDDFGAKMLAVAHTLACGFMLVAIRLNAAELGDANYHGWLTGALTTAEIMLLLLASGYVVLFCIRAQHASQAAVDDLQQLQANHAWLSDFIAGRRWNLPYGTNAHMSLFVVAACFGIANEAYEALRSQKDDVDEAVFSAFAPWCSEAWPAQLAVSSYRATRQIIKNRTSNREGQSPTSIWEE